METRIVVVRHGQTTHNRDKIISGYHADPALTEAGKAQAKETQAKLAHIQFDEVYSSDLQRAAHTAAIIHGQPVHETHQLEGLRERKFGSIDGTSNDNLSALRDNAEFAALSEEERWQHRFDDDMESDHDVAQRFIQTLHTIADTHPGKTILVGAHGGTLRTILIELGYAKFSELVYGSISNAAFAELIYKNGKFTVGEVGGITKKIS